MLLAILKILIGLIVAVASAAVIMFFDTHKEIFMGVLFYGLMFTVAITAFYHVGGFVLRLFA